MTSYFDLLTGVVVLSLMIAQSHCIQPSRRIARERGPEIFNAIHDSMRQWGSSLHHNGMSTFLATIPNSTLLYHGNNHPESPISVDWLAYEIEHAEEFARDFSPPRDNVTNFHEHHGYEETPAAYHLQQQRLGGAETPVKRGWLHVYQTTRPLRLLYVDGMAGAKTRLGTLDSQDYLLRDKGFAQDDYLTTGNASTDSPMGERQRAAELCTLCEAWGLDGVIRMEAGFEIIKCDFTDGLEEIQALPRRVPTSGHRGRQGKVRQFEYVRGLAERYHGIGSSRTTIDYSSMVSAFFFPIDLRNRDPDRSDLPRLCNASDEELVGIRTYLAKSIKERQKQGTTSIDWQGVSDLLVGRYADRIETMATKVNSTELMAAEVDFLLDVFINYSETNHLAGAISRCTDFYLRPISFSSEVNQLIFDAFQAVTSRICTTLFKVRGFVAESPIVGESLSLATSQETLTSLMEFLGWSRFMRSPACEVDEVCFVPMWPMGDKQDYRCPRCIDATGVRDDGESYWREE